MNGDFEYLDKQHDGDNPKYNKRKYEPGGGFNRYDNSLRNLIPIRKNKEEDKTNSIDNAGLISSVFFSWLSRIMYKAHSKGITIEELPSLSSYDRGNYNADRLDLLWETELKTKGPIETSFARIVWKFCRTRILASCFVFTCSLMFGVLSYTVFMRRLLMHVESGNESYEEGIKWTALLILGEMLRVFCLAWAWSLNYRTALRLRSGALTMVYRKIIRVNNLENKNIGKVINAFSIDAQRIFDVIVFGPLIVGAPISTIIGVFYIIWLLGPMAFLGMLAFLLFYPLQYMISRLAGILQTKAVKISDMRVRLMNEILDCIKLIKMYTWEKRFTDDLLALREKERKVLLKTAFCQSFSSAVSPAMPIISAIITFLAHVSSGNSLTAAQVFSYTTLLESGLRSSLCFFQDSVEAIVLARISFRRMKSLLLLNEGNCTASKPIIESQALAISHGTFYYNTPEDEPEDTEKKNNEKSENEELGNISGNGEAVKLTSFENVESGQVLSDISFEAGKGKLIGICGTVGSGKSSLLLAALGQLRISKGKLIRQGSCAYASQQAWITNATLRENIIFGSPFDKNRYQAALFACNLLQDVETMPGGDATEIGEKGVNLSGGQKQRVALARALYADRDIYFLDDPLSAVDSRVGSHIFNNLILGALKEKTVIFVTHQIQYLNRCDDIYMMRDGRIIEHGTHNELMKLGNEYALMVTTISKTNETEDKEIEVSSQPVEDISKISNRDANIDSNQDGESNIEKINVMDTQLTVADNVQQGTVKAHTYHAYIKAAGGYLFFALVLLTFLLTDASLAFSPWWLAVWIRAGEGGGNETTTKNETSNSGKLFENPDLNYYRNIYAGTIGLILITSILRSLVYTKCTVTASTNLHNHLFKKVIKSPMRFFDTTPTGRIQHLFSRDMDEVDNRLPLILSYAIQNVMMVLFAMLIICLVLPWFLIPLCILGVFYVYVSQIFRVAIRDLKRMDNKARSPIISFVTATVQGLSTIHAFEKEDNFLDRFVELFDENSKCSFTYSVATRWLAARIDALSVTITGMTAILVIALQKSVSPPLAGLALAYAAQISGVFQYTIQTITETEVRFISVERINHYLRTLITEGSSKQSVAVPSSSSWPSSAEIKFANVCMAYGEGAPLILKNVTFSISGGEKIGIVGRTGSGKSSLTVALYRLVEICEGKIEIDDVDISQLSLDQLRAKLSIIPQDPILFSGTVRSNLDPFNLYTDSEIWESLEKTELKTRVQSIPGQLDAPVGFGGDNMSVGERQLLCLSRALLRNSKILILDEATAAVDPETEQAVQTTVQKEFSKCTILTIAHRLQTVLSLDRVLVMHDGKLLEFDTPSNLLENKDSEFSKMIAAAANAENQGPAKTKS